MFETQKFGFGFLLAISVAAILFASIAAGNLVAADSGLDASKSTIITTFKQEGVTVNVPFTTFSGHINYDPDDAAASSATIEVATSSLDLGDEAYNEEVRKKEWFDSATWPKATFKSTAIEPTGASGFVATGELSIKGKTQTIKVPISSAATAEGNTFDGEFDLSREAFGIGDPMWNDVLEDIVKVSFHLVSSDR